MSPLSSCCSSTSCLILAPQLPSTARGYYPGQLLHQLMRWCPPRGHLPALSTTQPWLRGCNSMSCLTWGQLLAPKQHHSCWKGHSLTNGERRQNKDRLRIAEDIKHKKNTEKWGWRRCSHSFVFFPSDEMFEPKPLARGVTRYS